MDRHFTLDHILHFRCFGNKPKLVAGVKLAWTDTFRHLISSLHSWGRTAPTPCVSNLNLIGDHQLSSATSAQDEHQAVCAAPHITLHDALTLSSLVSRHSTWFLIWESKLPICSDRLSIRCFSCFVVKLHASARTNECINTILYNMNFLPSGICFYLSVAICWFTSRVDASWWWVQFLFCFNNFFSYAFSLRNVNSFRVRCGLKKKIKLREILFCEMNVPSRLRSCVLKLDDCV